MARYVLLIGYDGTHFCGSQRQKNARTVQSVLEEAAEKVFGAPVTLAFSGRTDAGVHAAGQVCHLDGETSVPPEKLREALNRLLPDDVKVLKSALAPAGFDCTRSARQKTYCYRFYAAETQIPLLERYAARVEQTPDLAKMEGACPWFVGEHDFAAYRATGSSAKTTVRTIFALAVRSFTVYGGTMYEVRVTGNGFLYNMMRILAGELYAVGCGKASKENVDAAFRTGDRTLLYKTMPAKGLTLERVDYGAPLFGAAEGETWNFSI